MSDFDAAAFAKEMNEGSAMIDAQIDALEDGYVPRPEYDRVCAERDALQHVIDCANTPLMAQVMAERDATLARAWPGGVTSTSGPSANTHLANLSAGNNTGPWDDVIDDVLEELAFIPEEADPTLAAIGPKYEHVCAERDAWKADAVRLAAVLHEERSTRVQDIALAAHDRLAAS